MKNRKILSKLLVTALLITVFTGCTPQKQVEVKEPVKESVTDSVKEPVIEQQVEVYKNPTVSSAQDAITLLKEGNKRFVNNELANYDLS